MYCRPDTQATAAHPKEFTHGAALQTPRKSLAFMYPGNTSAWLLGTAMLALGAGWLNFRSDHAELQAAGWKVAGEFMEVVGFLQDALLQAMGAPCCYDADMRCLQD